MGRLADRDSQWQVVSNAGTFHPSGAFSLVWFRFGFFPADAIPYHRLYIIYYHTWKSPYKSK